MPPNIRFPPKIDKWESPQGCPSLIANSSKNSFQGVFNEIPTRVGLELGGQRDSAANGVLLSAGIEYHMGRAMYRFDDSVRLDSGEIIDTASTIIYTQGAARHNETEAAWAVYCGPDSRYNSTGSVSHRFPQTKLAADFEANHRALYIACRATVRSPGSVITFTIATNSWLVMSMMTGGVVQVDDMTYATILGMINESVEIINEMSDGGHKFRYGWVSEYTNRRALSHALRGVVDAGNYPLPSLS